MLHVEHGMTSRSKLVIYLEQPDIHVEIVNDQARERNLKLFPVLDVVGAHWDWNVAKLEDALRS